jgi:hypothetical protein
MELVRIPNSLELFMKILRILLKVLNFESIIS